MFLSYTVALYYTLMTKDEVVSLLEHIIEDIEG